MYVNALIANDPSQVAKYFDLGIIDPDTRRVDFSRVDPEQATQLNDRLEKLLPPYVEMQIDDMVERRDQIAGEYKLVHPDEFVGR